MSQTCFSRPVVFIATLGLAGAMVACSGSSPSAAPPSAVAATALPVASVPPAATISVASATPAAATPVATGTPEPPSSAPQSAAATSGDSADDAASLLPDEISGITIDKVSLTWQEYVDLASGGQPEVAQMLNDVIASLGATVEDISVAQGNGYADDGYVIVGATLVPGADAEQMLQLFVQNLIDGAPLYNEGMSASAEQVSLGDKQVTKVTTKLGGSTVVDRQYLFRIGDAVFTVKGTSDELIAEAVRQIG